MLREGRNSKWRYCTLGLSSTEVSSGLRWHPGVESQPWPTGCMTLGRSCVFINLFTHMRYTESTEMLEAPKWFCPFWMHPLSLSISKVLSPVLTSHNLIPLLSDVTRGVRGRWDLWEAVELVYLQDGERENRKGTHLAGPWEFSPSWSLLLYGTWRHWFEWLECESQATADAQRPMKNPGQDLLESNLLVGRDTEDVHIQPCCNLHPGLF